MEEGKHKYRIGQPVRTEESTTMQTMVRNVGAAVVIALLTWTANTIQKTVVTVAEIQKDVLNLSKQTEKDLTVVNNAVTNLRIEFRDYKNEQRANGSGYFLPNSNQGPRSGNGPSSDSDPRMAPQLFRGDPTGDRRERIRDSSLDSGEFGDQLRDSLLRPSKQASAK